MPAWLLPLLGVCVHSSGCIWVVSAARPCLGPHAKALMQKGSLYQQASFQQSHWMLCQGIQSQSILREIDGILRVIDGRSQISKRCPEQRMLHNLHLHSRITQTASLSELLEVDAVCEAAKVLRLFSTFGSARAGVKGAPGNTGPKMGKSASDWALSRASIGQHKGNWAAVLFVRLGCACRARACWMQAAKRLQCLQRSGLLSGKACWEARYTFSLVDMSSHDHRRPSEPHSSNKRTDLRLLLGSVKM